MNSAFSSFELTLGVLLAFCSLYTIYFNFVRAVIVTRFHFYISEARDDLTKLLLADKVHPNDASVAIIRQRIQRADEGIESITVTDLLLALSPEHLRAIAVIREENAVIKASVAELRAVSTKLDLAVAGSFAANSPLLLGSVVILVFGATFWSWMALNAKRGLTSYFWDTLYIESSKHQRTVVASA